MKKETRGGELTEAATRLFHRAAGGRLELWAPDLVYPESVSALRKLVRLGSVSDAERAVGALTDLPIATTGSASLMAEAWRMRDFLTPYDACYVSPSPPSWRLPFVTAERALVVELEKRGRNALHLGDL